MKIGTFQPAPATINGPKIIRIIPTEIPVFDREKADYLYERDTARLPQEKPRKTRQLNPLAGRGVLI